MFLKSFLLGAVLGGALLIPAHAQAPRQADKSGYELLVEARTKLLPGPNGGASSTEANLSPEENLKRERLAVARNAPALALVRQALQQPIEVPQNAPDQVFPIFAGVRELARQLSQESDVRLADGDFVGAMNSKLDTVEMGGAISRGSLIAGLVGIAVQSIGFKGADKVATHLSAEECRQTAARLQNIEARRPSLTQVLRDEERYSLFLETGYLADAKTRKDIKPDPDGELPFATAKDIEQIKTLTPDKLARDNALVFDALVQSAKSPYSNAAPLLPPASEVNPFTRSLFLWADQGRYRFNFERPVVQDHLLRAALELRAQKLESGVYPAQFNAPLDPFSPDTKPLVYKKTATGFSLYSVGPDGKDDGGAPIQTILTDEDTGAKTTNDRLAPNSTGDIVQAPF